MARISQMHKMVCSDLAHVVQKVGVYTVPFEDTA